MPGIVSTLFISVAFVVKKSSNIFDVVSVILVGCVTTVELRWLELVGTVVANSTHPCVRAIPSLTIFKLVHVYFMSSRTPRSTKVAKRT